MPEPRRMLRGRIVRRQICESKSVAELIKRRTPWAGLLFERLILWADDDGRFLAEPEVLASKCLPWHSRSSKQIVADLEVMAALGMVHLYRVHGTTYGWFPKWEKHQPRNKSDRYVPSELPPAPDANVPLFGNESLPNRSESETSRSLDSNRTVPNSNLVLPPPPADGDTDPSRNGAYQTCVKTYCEGFERMTSEKGSIDKADGKLLKERLAEYSTGEDWRKVLTVIRHALSGEDPWLKENPPALRVILSKAVFTRLLGKLALDWKEKHA